MVLDFNSFRINESSLKKLKKEIHGALERNDRKRMRHELKHNIITFKFRKRNGELRTAHGTLHPDYLPPLKGGSPRPELQMVYFDLDKDGWRSFRAYKFIKITDIKPVDGTVKPSKSSKHSSVPVSSSSKSSKPIKSEDEEIKKVHTKPEEERVEKEETKKVHSEKSEKEVHKEVEKDIEKEEHKEHHKEVEKEEPEKDSDDIKEPEDDEVFSKKEAFKISEHSEEDEHKEHHKHKTEDED